MHYLTIPQNEKLKAKDGTIVDFSFHQMLGEHVWGHANWRKDEAWQHAWDRLVEALDEEKTPPGTVVPIEDKDWEKFAPLATLSGGNISGDVTLVKATVRLTRAVTFAATKDPRPSS